MKKVRELTEKEFQAFVASAKSKSYMQSAQMYQRYLGENREEYLLILALWRIFVIVLLPLI